jgi:uncharacterized metal-binding protein YceD (DUF177 family)
VTPEFHRPERLDTIGDGERTVLIVADPDERARLAARFDLLAIDRLEASFAVRRHDGAIRASGRVVATVVQACSATGEPVTGAIDEPVALRFAEETDTDQERELDGDAIDTLPIEGGAIDLGEAAAETMALALDPFPRAPDAQAVLRAAGVISDDEAKPVGKLAGLKDLLAKGQ